MRDVPSVQGPVELLSSDASALAQAIAEGHVHVAYQPVVCLSLGMTHGAEAFARWRTAGEPERRSEDIVSLAEATGLIVPLGTQVLRRVVEAIAQAGPPTRVSVNLSPHQLRDATLATTVARVLDEHDVPAESLGFEVSASAALSDLSTTATVLEDLRSLGCAVGVDDLGIGFGAMRLLDTLELDMVKIDRLLVGRLLRDPDVITLVAALAGRAQEQGMAVIADGIEHVEQARWLLDLGCQLGQGPLYDEPVDWLVLPTPHRCDHH